MLVIIASFGLLAAMVLMRCPVRTVFQEGTMMALPLTAASTYYFGTRWLKGPEEEVARRSYRLAGCRHGACRTASSTFESAYCCEAGSLPSFRSISMGLR